MSQISPNSLSGKSMQFLSLSQFIFQHITKRHKHEHQLENARRRNGETTRAPLPNHNNQDSSSHLQDLPQFYFQTLHEYTNWIGDNNNKHLADHPDSHPLQAILHHCSLGLSHLVFYSQFLMPLEQQSPTLQYYLNRCMDNMKRRNDTRQSEQSETLAIEETNNARQTWSLLLRCLGGLIGAPRASSHTHDELRHLLKDAQQTIHDLMNFHDSNMDRFLTVQCTIMAHLKTMYRAEGNIATHMSGGLSPNSKSRSIPVTMSRNQIRDLSEANFTQSVSESQQPDAFSYRRKPASQVEMSISDDLFTAYDPTKDNPIDDDEFVEMGIQESIAKFPSTRNTLGSYRNDDHDSSGGFSPRSNYSAEGSLNESHDSMHRSATKNIDKNDTERDDTSSDSHESQSLTQSFDRVVRESVAEFEDEFDDHVESTAKISSNVFQENTQDTSPSHLIDQHSYHPEFYEQDEHADSTLELDSTTHNPAVFASSPDSSPSSPTSQSSSQLASHTSPLRTPKQIPSPRNTTPDLNTEENSEIKFTSPRARPTTSTHSQRDFWHEQNSRKTNLPLDHRRRSHAQFDELNNEARNALIVPKKKEHLSTTDQIREMKKENHMLRMMLLDQQMKSQRDRERWDSLIKQESMKARTETMRQIGKQKRPSSVQGPRSTGVLRVESRADSNADDSSPHSGNSAISVPSGGGGARRRPSTTPGGARTLVRGRSNLSDSSSSHSTSHSSKQRGSLPSARIKLAGNRTMIENAVRRACLPGKVNESAKMQAMDALNMHETDRYLISLARENSTTCRGIYALDMSEEEPFAVRIYGKGPKKFTNKSVKSFFRYSSTSKAFLPQESKTHTLSDLRVDAVLLTRKPSMVRRPTMGGRQ